MFSQSIIRYGSETPLPAQVPLRAGPLKLIYEDGDLRYVRLGDHELLRRVYVAVRDHNWGTVPAVLSDVEMVIGKANFAITYTARHRHNDVDFVWHSKLTGAEDGTIQFTMEGEAQSTFRRNRIGFCVLHPMSCAGDQAIIEHMDGSLEESHFPMQIAPQLAIDGTIRPVYPFAGMHSLTHAAGPQLMAKVAFSGDIFEMEDQRNWTDASYKTYSTPLELPFPVEVVAGTKIVQSVTLTLEGAKSEAKGNEDKAGENVVTLVVDRAQAEPLLAIGLGVASHGQPLSKSEIERLHALNLSHLRVDLCLADSGYVEQLLEATRQAKALGVALEVALFVNDNANAELVAFRRQLDGLAPPVCRWLIYHQDEPSTSASCVDVARQHLGDYSPSASFGAGSNAYFTEINREHPDTHNVDFLCYSLNPQVHAFDNTSLMETVAAQAATVDSARCFADGKPIVVSPVTLLPRFNPNATGPEPEPTPGELPSQVDPRQMSLFGAAWTVGSLKHLLGSGVEAVTYFETTGWRGLLERDTGCPAPELFHSMPGMAFPLYQVFADVGEFAGGEILAVTTSDSLGVDGLALRRGDDLMLLAANFTPHPQQIQIECLGLLGRLRLLDEDVFDDATGAPEQYRNQTSTISATDGVFALELGPYCVARIETNVKIQALIDECLPLIKAMGKGRTAVSLGGSYGKGVSDRRSDIDFRLFCDEIDGAPQPTDTAAWRSFCAVVDRWRAEGIDIDYCWRRTVGQIDGQLDEWLSGQVQSDDVVWSLWGYQLLTDLANQLVLDDPDGLIAAWQARLIPYPGALQQAIIGKHMQSLNYWRNDYHYRSKVEREDVVFLAGVTSRLVHDMMQILFAVNKTYYVGDGKNLDFVAGFSIQPESFAERVDAILYPERTATMFVSQYEALMQLVNEVTELATRIEA